MTIQFRTAPTQPKINPCVDASPCAPTAICTTQNDRASCNCPPGLIGDPFKSCFAETPARDTTPINQPECRSDDECSVSQSCINQRCQNPCAERNPCSANAECRVSQHRPICFCPEGWGGDPQRQCFRRKISLLFCSYIF